jgi:uncharacterized protein
VRLSAFNIYLSDFPEPGATLVYNTFSGGFVTLDAETLGVLRKADGGGALDEHERALLAEDWGDFADSSVGIVVESRTAEERDYRAWHEESRSKTDRLHCIVSTTFACNLDCTYCCQSDVLDGTTMKGDLGAATAEWLAARALEIGAREIALDFVGGEPLLHPQRIEQIVNDIRARVADRGVRVIFGLITNGTHLTPALVERWRPLGLRHAQITLDGDETTHSITRRSKKKGEDSFATIFANTIAASKHIEVKLNGNYQPETVHGFVPLLDKLRAAGLTPGSRVSFTPALTALGAPSDAASGSCLWAGSSPELMIALGDEVWRHGFKGNDPGTIGPCSFHERHSYAIDPEGHIYKCPGFLGKSDWAIGHVRSGLTARYHGLANANPQRLCGSCAHRPDCAGGCVAAEWLRTGRMEGVNCEITFFEQNRDELIKRKYALAAGESIEESLALFPAPKTDIPRAPGRRSVKLNVLTAA